MRARGFSFVELMASLAIMAILLLIAVPSARLAMQRHHEAELRVALADIRGAIDRYKKAADDGRILRKPGDSGYPPSLAVLSDGVVDVSSPNGTKMYFLRRLPRDPLNPGDTGTPAETWALRAYDSLPDSPAEGKDVFDVSSRSLETGLNGIPYSEW